MGFTLLGILSSAGASGGLAGAGYVALGFAGFDATATIDKISIPSDTRTTLGTGLSSARPGGAGFANSGVAGYFAGGEVGGSTEVTTVDKFAFPADTRTTLGTGLGEALTEGSAMANSAVAGYHAGGKLANNNRVSTNYKFAFPSDTRSTTTALSAASKFGSGFANSGTAGYVHLGDADSDVTTVNKFAFPADTRTTLATGLSVAKSNTGAFADVGVAGYVGGGSSIDKFAFPADTRTTLAVGLNTGGIQRGFARSGGAGYFVLNNGSGNEISKFAFPSDTRSVLTSVFSAVPSSSAALADSGIL